MCVFVGGAYDFDQLGNGDLELHSDWIRDVLHRSDELVVLSEESPEEPVLCLGGQAAWADGRTDGQTDERERESVNVDFK